MPALLTTYEDFVARVESLGFMALSHLLPGLPSLGDETAESLWHTGLDTDPWRWKDRAANTASTCRWGFCRVFGHCPRPAPAQGTQALGSEHIKFHYRR